MSRRTLTIAKEDQIINLTQQAIATTMTNVDCSTVNIGKIDADQLLKESFQLKVPHSTYKHKIKVFRAWVDEANGLTKKWKTHHERQCR